MPNRGLYAEISTVLTVVCLHGESSGQLCTPPLLATHRLNPLDDIQVALPAGVAVAQLVQLACLVLEREALVDLLIRQSITDPGVDLIQCLPPVVTHSGRHVDVRGRLTGRVEHVWGSRKEPLLKPSHPFGSIRESQSGVSRSLDQPPKYLSDGRT